MSLGNKIWSGFILNVPVSHPKLASWSTLPQGGGVYRPAEVSNL